MKSNTIEILDILQEECAEVIQAASKVKRFGWESTFEDGPTNRTHLTTEVGDLMAMVQLLVVAGDLNVEEIEKATLAKLKKLRVWSKIFE